MVILRQIMKAKLILLIKFLHKAITRLHNYILFLEERDKKNE